MVYQQHQNTGALFKARHRSSDKAPTHTGTINVEGTVFRLAAWVKETKSGEKYFSLKVTMADAQPKKERAKQDERDLADDIPWK